MLDDVGVLKNTDIPIMDVASTGSSIAKKKFNHAFIFTDIVEVVFDETKKKKVVKETKEDAHQEEMNFINDFKI